MPDKDYAEWGPEWSHEDEREIEAGVIKLRKSMSALRALREQLGVSQEELAAILGVTQSNVSKMEVSAKPRISVLRKLIEHKGGRLRIVAEFDGKETDLSLF